MSDKPLSTSSGGSVSEESAAAKPLALVLGYKTSGCYVKDMRNMIQGARMTKAGAIEMAAKSDDWLAYERVVTVRCISPRAKQRKFGKQMAAARKKAE